jgi:hypothetical protein
MGGWVGLEVGKMFVETRTEQNNKGCFDISRFDGELVQASAVGRAFFRNLGWVGRRLGHRERSISEMLSWSSSACSALLSHRHHHRRDLIA